MKEKVTEEKVEKGKIVKVEKEAESPRPESEKGVVKKWKGKDWFVVLSPKIFGENYLAETPTTDPKSLIGRNIEVNVAELTNQANKYYMKLKFKINRVDGKTAYTQFDGYVILKEYLFRVIRKGTQKVQLIKELETKDKWKLQITATVVLNRNTNAEIQKKVRKFIEDYLSERAQASTIDDFITGVINSVYQRNIKKKESKTYPIRFSEIEKIEVLKAPAD